MPGLSDRLQRWAADARAAESARIRREARSLARQAEDDATFADAMLDLAEHQQAVVVHGRGGRRHRGAVGAVGRGFLTICTDDGREVLIAAAALDSVRTDAGLRTGTMSPRASQVELSFAEALAALAAEQACVLLVTTGGEPWRGEIRGVGQDVVALGPDGDPRAVVFVRVDAIAEISLV